MDEWAGQMIPLFAAASFTQIEWPYIWMAAFFTFRLFDYPQTPGNPACRAIRGASGIMLDDFAGRPVCILHNFFRYIYLLHFFFKKTGSRVV